MRISDTNDGLTHRMPAHFRKWPVGGGVCPYDDCTTLVLSYLTDGEKLRTYIPEEFSITRPVVMISYAKCSAIQWMGGSEYSYVAASVPVQYRGGKDPIDGVYQLVIWEDKTEPILGGREEAGMPKIFADIPEYRRLGNSIVANVSHEGRTFLDLEFSLGKQCTPSELAAMNENNGRIVQFGWRYIPKVGPYPGASLSEATYYPVDNTYASASVCTGTVKWTALPYQQHPSQFDVIGALASLPIREYLPGYFRKGTTTMRMDLARSLP